MFFNNKKSYILAKAKAVSQQKWTLISLRAKEMQIHNRVQQ